MALKNLLRGAAASLGKDKSMHHSPPDRRILEGRTLFVGLGAMKAGTSWVSDYLQAHPAVFHSPLKEMNFFSRFDDDALRITPLEDQRALWSNTLEYWRERTRNILLEKAWAYPPSREQYETLQAIAELEIAREEGDYLDFFARRIGSQKVFGEICPQYAFLSPQMFRRITQMGFDTRFLFFMRDPASRMVSNIQHLLRRSDFDVDAFIQGLHPGVSEYARSNYLITLRNHQEAGTNAPLKVFIYEELFNERAVSELCAFLGIANRKADFSRRVNAARGADLSEDQKSRIREKLDPVYRELEGYFGAAKPASWKW